MSKTTNYGLEKPEQDDYYDVDVFNGNADIVDEELAKEASDTQFGRTKLTNSSAVTNSDGFALSATEKNASIDGTLANQIAKLNTDTIKPNVANSYNSVYIAQGNKNPWTMYSGIKIGLPYNTNPDSRPAFGLGSIYGEHKQYLSLGMEHHCDSSTKELYWRATVAYERTNYSPMALVLNAEDGALQLYKATKKAWAELERIPDDDITITTIA